jgi:hypothetical protein
VLVRIGSHADFNRLYNYKILSISAGMPNKVSMRYKETLI